jgi:transposase-like protein
MGSKMAKNYSPEFREQIIKECMETNKYNVVAKKHQVPVTKVYTWIKRDKNKSKVKSTKFQPPTLVLISLYTSFKNCYYLIKKLSRVQSNLVSLIF